MKARIGAGALLAALAGCTPEFSIDRVRAAPFAGVATSFIAAF